jgi:hypothetical protein
MFEAVVLQSPDVGLHGDVLTTEEPNTGAGS